MSWQDALNHRPRIIVWTSIDLIVPVVMSLLFKAIYSSPESLINGFNYSDLLQYYLIITFLKVLIISYPHENVSEGIWRGNLSKHLVRPISFPLYQLSAEIGWRLVAALLFSPLILAIAYIFKLPLIVDPSPLKFISLIIILALSFIVYWLFDFIFGLTAFWFTDISGIINVKHVIFTLLSGRLVPPQFLPLPIQKINEWLPFQYILAYPVELAQKNINPSSFIHTTLILTVFGAAFLGIFHLMWKKGLKQYTAVGI
jgi:ABC-2 type transport system permease protein